MMAYERGTEHDKRFDYATCGTCGRTWDDSIITGMTPAPSARCPFEYFHDGETVPEDYEVKVIHNDR